MANLVSWLLEHKNKHVHAMHGTSWCKKYKPFIWIKRPYNCMTFHARYKIAIYHLQFYCNLKNLEHKNERCKNNIEITSCNIHVCQKGICEIKSSFHFGHECQANSWNVQSMSSKFYTCTSFKFYVIISFKLKCTFPIKVEQ
jgi:hypothetical protein